MVDCVTNQRLNGIINSQTPYDEWKDHILSCTPNSAAEAATLGVAGVAVTITLRDDDRYYITSNVETEFILEVALTQKQAENVCDALGWVY